MSTVASAHPAMSLLDSGVPLTLLLDLAWGPSSEELLVRERPGVDLPEPRPAS